MRSRGEQPGKDLRLNLGIGSLAPWTPERGLLAPLVRRLIILDLDPQIGMISA